MSYRILYLYMMKAFVQFMAHWHGTAAFWIRNENHVGAQTQMLCLRGKAGTIWKMEIG